MGSTDPNAAKLAKKQLFTIILIPRGYIKFYTHCYKLQDPDPGTKMRTRNTASMRNYKLTVPATRYGFVFLSAPALPQS
jgi:hypothetical protein